MALARLYQARAIHSLYEQKLLLVQSLIDKNIHLMRDLAIFRPTNSALAVFSLCLAQSGLALSQQTTPPFTNVNEQSKAMEVVEVKKTRTSAEKSSDFVAGKLIISRKNIAESGDQQVQEILRKHPAITISGDGKLGLNGMPGYTQILIDGAPSISSKSPLELDLIHVERIEIIKSSIAELGPYGIAGTINIITRRSVDKKKDQLNVGGTANERGYSSNFSSSIAIEPDTSTFIKGIQISGGANSRDEKTDTITRSKDLTVGRIVDYTNANNEHRNTRQLSIGFNGDVQLSSDHHLEIDPSILFLMTRKNSDSLLKNSGNLAQTTRVSQSNSTPFTSISIPLNWTYNSESGSRLKLRYAPTYYEFESDQRSEDLTTGAASKFSEYRNLLQRTSNRLNLLKSDFQTSVNNELDIKLGLTLNHNHGSTQFESRINDMVDETLAGYGNHNKTIDFRKTAFVQAEWRVNDRSAYSLGTSIEDRHLQLVEGEQKISSAYTIIAPSFHFAWKLEGKDTRQLRLSIARTFNAPFIDQILQRPKINPLAPCSIQKICIDNHIDTPDKSGNKDLLPELSNGINLSYDHYLANESQLSFNLFSREIKRLISNEVELSKVDWSNKERYVLKPRNIGDAYIIGVGIEAQLTLKEFVSTAPDLTISIGTNFARSQIRGLPSKDSHITEFSPWNAKFGIYYQMAELPLKLAFNWNGAPEVWTQTSVYSRSQAPKSGSANFSGTWNLNRSMRLKFSVENVNPSLTNRIFEYQDLNKYELKTSRSKTFPKIGVRLETSY